MDELLPRALPLDSYSKESFDENDLIQPATSAQEYLRRVRYEAQRCPDVVVADLPELREMAVPTLSFTENMVQVPTIASSRLPTSSWRLNQTACFSDVRKKLSRYKEQNAKYLEDNKPQMPKMRDELGWCRYCLGSAFMDAVVQDRLSKGEDIVPPDVDEFGLPNIPIETTPKPPLLSILLCIDQTMLQQVLEYHVGWLTTMGFTISQGCWFYCIMSCLEKPLLPDCASSLRTMARVCQTVRANLENHNDERLPSLNLLITLVAHYFDQGDLMDKG